MKNTVKHFAENLSFLYLTESSKIKSLEFFEFYLDNELYNTTEELSINLMHWQNQFKEFKDAIVISVFQKVCFDLNENNRLEQMTNKEIIEEVIFQLI